MSNLYLEKMKQLVFKGGKIALAYRDDSSPAFKADKSIITRTDREISQLAQDILMEFLILPGHILIDEEDENRAHFLDEDFLKNNPYIFAIDPVDGTRIYANGMPNFGISIGLLKDRKPWLEAIRELIRTAIDRGEDAVIACSALKDSYRRMLQVGADVIFVYRKANASLIQKRLKQRTGHFMNPTLIESQFATLEEPHPAVQIDAGLTPAEIVQRIRNELSV